jgi:hypothetical protein
MSPIPASGPRFDTNETRPAGRADSIFFDLQLRIARRADELTMAAPLLRERSLECWLWAERAVIAEAFGPGVSTPRLS